MRLVSVIMSPGFFFFHLRSKARCFLFSMLPGAWASIIGVNVESKLFYLAIQIVNFSVNSFTDAFLVLVEIYIRKFLKGLGFGG